MACERLMKKIDMCNGPMLRPMIMFVIPILLTNVLQQLINVADVILAGRLGTSGSDAVAAVGSTTAITSLLINFFIGCSTGSAVTVSHAVGSGSSKDIKETVHTAMFLSLVLGTVLSVVGILFSELILNLMGTPEDILGKAADYLKARFLGMVAYMVYNFGAAILRAVGETQKPLYFLMVSGPLKLVLTIVFVAVFKMDVVGLALATAVSQMVSATLVVITLMKREDACKLVLKELKFYAKPLKKVLRLGIPSGIQSATFSLSNVVIQSSVNSLKAIPGFITGNAAACSISGFTDILTGVFYNAALNFTGQNVGAKKYDRVKKSYIVSSSLSLVTLAVFSALVCIFASEISGLYIDDSAIAIKWSVTRIICIFPFSVIQAVMDTTSGMLRGMGVSVSNTIINLLGVCGFRILWCMTIFKIPDYHTPQTLFASYPVSWAITFIAQFVVFVVIYKKRKNKYQTSVKTDQSKEYAKSI